MTNETNTIRRNPKAIKGPRRNWSEEEQRIVIAAYINMLVQQERGESFNKAAIARAVLPLLNNRSKGSYEAKLMNISAVMAASDLPIVQGYKAFGNGQKSLGKLVAEVLAMDPATTWQTLKVAA